MSPESLTAVLVAAIAVNLFILLVLVAAVLTRRGREEMEYAAPPPSLASPERIESAVTGAALRPPERVRRAADEVEAGWPEPGPGEGEEAPHDLMIDPETGLASRFAWDHDLRLEEQRRHRYGRPVTVVVTELEGLDRLVERVGPEAAERLVPAVGEALRRYARASDVVARVGAARFHIMLPETDEVRAINYIERVRAACDLWLQAGAVSLRLSIGWASPSSDQSLDDAMRLAEERLYVEQRRQRDRVAAV